MSPANVNTAEFISLRSFRFRSRSINLLRRGIWMLVIAASVTTSGCATPHAILDIAAPSAVTAGTPFTITVTAIYQGQQDTAVNTVVHFTSTDKDAVLPRDYWFVSADRGFHSFPNGVTLKTPGNQTISASLYMATGINGSVVVTVSAQNAAGSEIVESRRVKRVGPAAESR